MNQVAAQMEYQLQVIRQSWAIDRDRIVRMAGTGNDDLTVHIVYAYQILDCRQCQPIDSIMLRLAPRLRYLNKQIIINFGNAKNTFSIQSCTFSCTCRCIDLCFQKCCVAFIFVDQEHKIRRCSTDILVFDHNIQQTIFEYVKKCRVRYL
jgi:hypothetical protein